MTIQVADLMPSQRAAWEVLACGYKSFYQTETTDAEYERAWQRLLAHDGVHGLGATLNGQLVGLAHFLFHTSTWAPQACYLQDLYTAPEARGHGVARALIDAVAAKAREAGATRYYWLTRENNAAARVLY
jgi:GNAT superfamily N-acetyltransferase